LEQHNRYRQLLVDLSRAPDPLVAGIYANAATSIKEPRHLAQLVSDIDGLDWFTAQQDGLGDLYEGLLQKNANETKSGAGQYFTPRPLIRAMVELVQPQPGEIVQDPSAGTGGFLIAADRYIKERTDDLFSLSSELQEFQRTKAFVGMELVPDTRRLALMNCMLHHIAAGRCDPGQPALWHQEGRRPAQPQRLQLPHEQQAAGVSGAHLPRPQARRPRRGGAA
jgi:type I restriction enzyme M protein